MNNKKIFNEQCTVYKKEFPTKEGCILSFSSTKIANYIGPGQFVNVLPPEISNSKSDLNVAFTNIITPYKNTLNSQTSLLRRPFSVYSYEPSPGIDFSNSDDNSISLPTFSILFQIKGKGTQRLAATKPGQKIDILGPLGNPFPLPEDPQQPIFLIAGGYGAAPLLPLAKEIAKRGNKIVFFYGVEEEKYNPIKTISNSDKDSFLGNLEIEVLQKNEIKSFVAVAKSNNSKNAFIGTVLDLFQEYLHRNFNPSRQKIKPYIYTCGPEGMMQSLTKFANEQDWECCVSLERFMACGVGACMSCVCKIKKNDDINSFQYLKTCTDGPSFRGADVIWE